MMKIDGIPLGTSIAPVGVDVTFTYEAQSRMLIQGIAIRPADVVFGTLNLTIVTRDPSRAKVERFENGATISDLGISSAAYPLEISPARPFMYRLQMPADLATAGRHWFMQEGVGYLRVAWGEHIMLTLNNQGERDVEAGALLLCHHAGREAA